MSETHLPECPDQHSSHDGTCICSALRACEARVREEERAKWSDLAHDNWQSGWEEGLDAARDAVAALPWKVAVSFGPIDCNQSCEHGPCTCSGVMRPEAWMTGPDEALAAIDALRGEA